MQHKNGVYRMRRWSNLHTHFRQKGMRELIVRLMAQHCRLGIVQGMPNTDPPLLTGPEAVAYLRETQALFSENHYGRNTRVVVSMQITEDTTIAMLEEALRCKVRMFKIYPRFVTTGSLNGVLNYLKIIPLLQFLQEKTVNVDGEDVEVVVQFHAEHPNGTVRGIDKESMFIFEILEEILQACPRLKIVVEHISSAVAANFVERNWRAGRKIAATIAVQYLVHTQDDLIGYTPQSNYLLQPNIACKPTYKFPPDLIRLIEAATSGLACFFYGGDDATHPKTKKIAESCCNGVANTIATPSMLMRIFIAANAMEKLEGFVAEFGPQFYGIPLPDEEIEIVPEEWIVPDSEPIPGMDDVVLPWMARQKMEWKIAG